ncbi:hypothetical protein [Alistipes putredinis]
MIEAARSLATRFREKPGIIQSWDVTREKTKDGLKIKMDNERAA